MAVNCFLAVFCFSLSPFLSVSCLPGVYLQHKDSALMMPQGCQYNQRVSLFMCTSCQKTKAYKLQLQRQQHELAPMMKRSFHHVTGTKIWTKALSRQSDIVFGWIPPCVVCLHLPTAFPFQKASPQQPNDRGWWQIWVHCGKWRGKISRLWSKNRYSILDAIFGVYLLCIFQALSWTVCMHVCTSVCACVRVCNYWHLRSGASLITVKRLAERTRSRLNLSSFAT